MNDFGMLLPISFCLLAKFLFVKRPVKSQAPDILAKTCRVLRLGLKTLLVDFYGLFKFGKKMGCGDSLEAAGPDTSYNSMSGIFGSGERVTYRRSSGAKSPTTPHDCVDDDEDFPEFGKAFNDEERFIAILNKKSGGKKGAELEECLVKMGIPCFDMLTFFGDAKGDAYRRLRNAIGIGSISSNSASAGGDDDNKEEELTFTDSAPLVDRVPIILVGGGDGSYAGACQIIDTALEDSTHLKPRVVPIPLGTGNDLSNALGWTPKCPNIPSGIPALLDTVIDRTKFVTGLDRWNIKFTSRDDDKLNSQWSKPSIDTILCYFSVGWDAKAASVFEKRRTANPDAFTSQFRNNMIYTELGIREIFSQSSPLSSEDFTLEVDGVNVEIPRGTRSVKVINIQSAQSGVDFWGSRDVGDANECSSKIRPACDDGVLEIVSTKGIWHMLSTRLGMGNAQRLGQGKSIKLTLHKRVPIQADGEAWWQEPCTIEIAKRDKIPVIVGPHNPRGDFSYSGVVWGMNPPSDQRRSISTGEIN